MAGIVNIILIANCRGIVYISIMPTDKPKIILVMEEELIERIDDFRFGNRINSRSEAIRRLIEEGLKGSDISKREPKKQ